MSLLHSFAALSLVSGIMTSLLPEGTLRTTASMAIGLLLLSSWMNGLAAAIHQSLPEGRTPDTVLSSGQPLLPLLEEEALSYLSGEAMP